MRILSPMPTGNGAYVLHEQLAGRIPGYRMRPYSPWWTLFPPALPAFARGQSDLQCPASTLSSRSRSRA